MKKQAKRREEVQAQKKAQKKSGQDERKDWGGRAKNEEAKDRKGPDNAENMYEG